MNTPDATLRTPKEHERITPEGPQDQDNFKTTINHYIQNQKWTTLEPPRTIQGPPQNYLKAIHEPLRIASKSSHGHPWITPGLPEYYLRSTQVPLKDYPRNTQSSQDHPGAKSTLESPQNYSEPLQYHVRTI